jgi:hypothetical protein
LATTTLRAISLIQTFAAIFYTQFTLSKESICMQRKGSYARCLREFHDEELWLTIEVLCFWLYFVAVIFYIFKFQLYGWCCPKKGKTDLAK